ncbi:hypothetical protein [Caminibacter pacificus]|uniref:Uncharacterized protein n=1 Tax=Caminibacter pacificus TaxID=1424653 RepID=A0AAJ4UY96_9BACT|nr:hypothetical protein [Caminibacter pacificus]ROR40247.1 hypothetical protein EDC58_1237 [Caminibacter pacificus]
MGWNKKHERTDKQGGTWRTYENEKGEKIVIRTNPNGSESVFKDGKKVNKQK